MRRSTTIVTTLAVLAVFGLATLALAGWGRGYGHMMGYGPGGGPGMMGPGWHRGYNGNFPPGASAELEKQRAAFFESTEDLRQQLYEKNLALQSELAKEDPDTAKASQLQGDISELRGELDQKRLDYDIQARKSSPDFRRDYGGGYGSMMGYGPRGGGYCGR